MSLKQLSKPDQEIIFSCLRCVSKGDVIKHDWEFELLMGITPKQLKLMVTDIPNLDDSKVDIRTAINNSMNNLLGFPHGRFQQWDKYVPVAKSEIQRVFALWREDFESMHKFMSQEQQDFLNNYLNTHSQIEREEIGAITVEHFCNNEIDANALGQLVVDGIKKATSSLKYWYDSNDEETIPQVGNLMLVTDFSGKPICITQTTSVEIKKFSEVDESFAYLEGEGDKSLAYWRNAHRNFFTKNCESEGVSFSEDMLLYLEKFTVVAK